MEKLIMSVMVMVVLALGYSVIETMSIDTASNIRVILNNSQNSPKVIN